MPIFHTTAKNGYAVMEDLSEHYESLEYDAKNPKDVYRLMSVIVRMITETSKVKLSEGDKKTVKKIALNCLRQMGYGDNNELRIKVLEALEKYLWGYYVLDDLINAADVTDIRVLNWNYIRYKKYGKRYLSSDNFIDEGDYIQFINLLAVRNKKNLSDINAITYFTDTSNEQFILRFNICTQLVSSGNVPVLTIRKIAKKKYSMEQLIMCNMLDEKIAHYLIDKAKNSSGILFTGKGASGKTTLMNTMLEYIDETESAVVIQESDELFISAAFDENGNEIPARDVTFLHTVSYNGDGKVEYLMPELTRNGLRMDLDYFIIGEIKGDEAEGFSMASYTGHKCWASVHGMNSYESINKLADYIKQATGYTFCDCLKKLIGIETVIFMKDFKVCEITEIYGYDERAGDLIKKVVFKNGEWIY